MRSLVFCCLTLTLATVVANGQVAADQEREAICKKVVCRDPTTVKLKVNESEYAEFKFPKGPYVADGFINVLSGEDVSVEFDEKDGELVDPRFVKEIVHPEHTVSVHLSHDAKGTMLRVSNPFSKSIVYKCMIQHYQQQSLSSTDVLVVHAGLTSYEFWSEPVPQVVISSVRYESSGGVTGADARSDTYARILSKPEPKILKDVPSLPASGVTIVLQAVFTSDAMVTSVRFVKVTPKDTPEETVKIFSQRAIEAAKQIKFTPAMKNGRSVSMLVQLEYNFTSTDEREQPAEKKPEAESSRKNNQTPGL